MNIQSDLFGEPTVADEPPVDRLIPATAVLRVLAMPCGFLNSRNEPCQRQASRPVMIDGSPLVCRGVSMLHCEPHCFRTHDTPRQSYDKYGTPAGDPAMASVAVEVGR